LPVAIFDNHHFSTERIAAHIVMQIERVADREGMVRKLSFFGGDENFAAVKISSDAHGLRDMIPLHRRRSMLSVSDAIVITLIRLPQQAIGVSAGTGALSCFHGRASYDRPMRSVPPMVSFLKEEGQLA